MLDGGCLNTTNTIGSSVNFGQGGPKQQIEQLMRQNHVLHEAIIDLYLQVKIRSNDEVIRFIINFSD